METGLGQQPDKFGDVGNEIDEVFARIYFEETLQNVEEVIGNVEVFRVIELFVLKRLGFHHYLSQHL